MLKKIVLCLCLWQSVTLAAEDFPPAQANPTTPRLSTILYNIPSMVSSAAQSVGTHLYRNRKTYIPLAITTAACYLTSSSFYGADAASVPSNMCPNELTFKDLQAIQSHSYPVPQGYNMRLMDGYDVQKIHNHILQIHYSKDELWEVLKSNQHLWTKPAKLMLEQPLMTKAGKIFYDCAYMALPDTIWDDIMTFFGLWLTQEDPDVMPVI